MDCFGLLTIAAHISDHIRAVVSGWIECPPISSQGLFPVQVRAVDRMCFTVDQKRDRQLLATQCPVGEARERDIDAEFCE